MALAEFIRIISLCVRAGHLAADFCAAIHFYFHFSRAGRNKPIEQVNVSSLRSILNVNPKQPPLVAPGQVTHRSPREMNELERRQEAGGKKQEAPQQLLLSVITAASRKSARCNLRRY